MHFPSSQSQHGAFCVARQPWHHALLMRWRTGNTVHCLLKEYYSSPQRENTKNIKNMKCLGSGQCADVRLHLCTFEREVIWAPSRLVCKHAFYPMTLKKSVENYKKACWNFQHVLKTVKKHVENFSMFWKL